MANKILNQDGQEIFAIGEQGSHVRNRTQYNKTLWRLVRKIDSNWMHEGLARHTDRKTLEFMCEDDNVPKQEAYNLIQSAYFYWQRIEDSIIGFETDTGAYISIHDFTHLSSDQQDKCKPISKAEYIK